jgi:asparagine synthase (glutamine-hydrolysing)
VVWHVEQPIVRTAPAPLYLLAALARERGYRVVLTGEGADELLGGYDIFKEAKVRRFCARQPGSARRPLLFRRLYPYLPELHRQPPSYLEAFFRARPDELRSPFFSHLPRWELTAGAKRFYSDEVRAALAGRDPYAEIGAALPPRYGAWDPFCQGQYLETAHLLGGYLLSSQGDRMAMAHGVEGRFPFLDVRVAELAARIPPRLKMKGLDEKHILKRAAADLVPASVLRRPKQPYRAPHADCFFDVERGRPRFDYVAELLSAPAIARGGLFHPGAVGRLVDKAKSGGVTGARDGMALVAILSAQLAVEQLIHQSRRSAT